MTRALESASILGAKNIVVHSITVPDGVDFEKYNIEYYKSFIPYCEKFGIHVAVENLFSRDNKRKRINGKLGSPEELSGIVEKINSPWIVACLLIFFFLYPCRINFLLQHVYQIFHSTG